MGSRSQLASPATERPATEPVAAGDPRLEKKSMMSPPELTASSSKRESFVEVWLF